MTANRRILLNVVATYGRSLYALIIGLFCGRWALMALGEVDYGLLGLVGGLTAFVSFLNGLLSASVGRFYAVAVGAAQKAEDPADGLDNCRRWFNTAVLIHTAVPLALIVIGYPCGEWAVRRFLTIPPDRVAACLWVWRFTCLTCFVGMVNVPFNAMYTAKQEIAELTVYGFVTSTLNVAVLYYMITHPGVWIVKYSLWTMLLAVSPQLVIAWRAIVKYPECRFNFDYLYCPRRIREIVNFAFARFWTALSGMASAQGNAILVNKYLGPALNASMSIGNMVAGQASSLSGALSGAFWPAIANKAGEGDEAAVRQFAFRTCRFGTMLILIFAIPLALEVDEVMRLWLKTPPAFVSAICVAVLVDMVLERMSEGYWMAIMGLGRRVGFYSGWVSVAGFARVLIAWLAFALGFGIYGLCVSLVITRILVVGIRLVLGRMLVKMSIREWAQGVCLPICAVTALTVAAGWAGRLIVGGMPFVRLCLTVVVCECVFLPLCWRFLLSGGERETVKGKVTGILRKAVCALGLEKGCRYCLFCARVRVVRLRYARIVARIRRRRGPVRVVFLAHSPAKWKTQSLYEALCRNGNFEPVVAVTFQKGELGAFRSPREKVLADVKFYEGLGGRCVVAYDFEKDSATDLRALQPDVVFFQEPWQVHVSQRPLKVSKFALCCYMTYSIEYIMDANDKKGIADDIHFMPYFHQMMYLNFTWGKAHAKYYLGKRRSWERAGTILGLGHTIMDQYEFQASCAPDGYVIYAPHFSIDHGDTPAILKLATFKENGRKILEYAQRHPEYNWLFKPHPSMRRWFVSSGYMSAEEIDRYFEAWGKVGKVCLDGGYPKLFNASRVLISDSSSFLMEYAATGRPIIRPVPDDLNVFPCPAARRVIDSLYETHGVDELMATIRMVLEEGRDPKRDERIAAAREAGLIGSHAAENIVNYFSQVFRLRSCPNG